MTIINKSASRIIWIKTEIFFVPSRIRTHPGRVMCCIFRPAFGMRSTQTLVEIYNSHATYEASALYLQATTGGFHSRKQFRETERLILFATYIQAFLVENNNKSINIPKPLNLLQSFSGVNVAPLFLLLITKSIRLK